MKINTLLFKTCIMALFVLTMSMSCKKEAKATEMSAFVKSYLEANLKISVDGKLMKPNYLGFENDHEATNVYLEIGSWPTFRTVSLSNGLLYDLFDDQMNILHLEKNGTRKSTKASFPEKTMSISF